MKIQSSGQPLTGSFGPKKATELFYITHPKAPKSLLGPFLTEADAECGRVVLRSPEAQVTACLVDQIDEYTRWHAESNGHVFRTFAEGVRHD